MQRIRIHYAKTQPLRYTGNLDVHKIWERAFRRSNLPIAYSLGFHPQPKINQACPLPLGMISRVEIVDIWLNSDLPIQEIKTQLEKKIPSGIDIDHIENIDLHEPALQTRITAATYEVRMITIPGETPVGLQELTQKVGAILSSERILRRRRDKDYDLRPYIQKLIILETKINAHPVLLMHLSAKEGATGRPEEVLSAMGFDPFSFRIERVGLDISMNVSTHPIR